MGAAVVVALILSVATTCGLLRPGPGEGRLEVVVLDSDGNTPATYELTFTPEPSSRGALQRTETGYVFFGFPSGEYVITVTAPGLSEAAARVEVEEGETARQVLRLLPATDG